jgi:hypothetical protein
MPSFWCIDTSPKGGEAVTGGRIPTLPEHFSGPSGRCTPSLPE